MEKTLAHFVVQRPDNSLICPAHVTLCPSFPSLSSDAPLLSHPQSEVIQEEDENKR